MYRVHIQAMHICAYILQQRETIKKHQPEITELKNTTELKNAIDGFQQQTKGGG